MRIFLFLFFFSQSFAQILNDAPAKQIILKSIDHIYAGNFSEAEQGISVLKEKYPKHPIVALMNSLKTSWQHFPIERNPQWLKIYQSQLDKCLELAEPMLNKQETATEAKFFLLAGHGFKALSLNYQQEYLKAGNEARLAFGYLKDGMKLVEANPEFYYTTGLYNFYVEQYPETHPIVKPVMVFFQDGNKKLGLEQLSLAAQKGAFVRIESLYYLVHIYLKYEPNLSKALICSKILIDKYPQNYIFMMRHIETLTLLNKLDEAQTYLNTLRKQPDRIFQVSANVLDAMIKEKQKDDKQAQVLYTNALKLPVDERYTQHFYAYAYAGLARIAHRKGDKTMAKTYYKKCLSIAEYKTVRAEAEKYLN